jgi:methyltransferase, putative, TIGR00027 family
MAKRIESKISRTAQITCLARAVSYTETRAYYHSDDYVSAMLVPSFFRLLLKMPFLRYCYGRFSPKGIYGYVIARTKSIDHEFVKALQEDYGQILILGASFDSRAIRFNHLSKNTRIYEMDSPLTQSAKIQRYHEMGIKTSDNLVFIPMDFDKQNIIDRLMESGFVKNKKTLFILEGLTMYLQPESVDQTFKIIQEYAGKESKIVFDYIYASVLRKENLYDGEKGLYKSVAKANEKWYFGIEKGFINEFLAQYDFVVLKH